MPRTVLIPVIGLAGFGVLALASFVDAVLELSAGGATSSFAQWALVVSQATGAVTLWATVRGLVRGSERARVAAFVVGVCLAFVFALVALVGALGGLGAGLPAPLIALTLGAAGLWSAVALSLSRASARAWFAAAAPRGVPQG